MSSSTGSLTPRSSNKRVSWRPTIVMENEMDEDDVVTIPRRRLDFDSADTAGTVDKNDLEHNKKSSNNTNKGIHQMDPSLGRQSMKQNEDGAERNTKNGPNETNINEHKSMDGRTRKRPLLSTNQQLIDFFDEDVDKDVSIKDQVFTLKKQKVGLHGRRRRRPRQHGYWSRTENRLLLEQLRHWSTQVLDWDAIAEYFPRWSSDKVQGHWEKCADEYVTLLSHRLRVPACDIALVSHQFVERKRYPNGMTSPWRNRQWTTSFMDTTQSISPLQPISKTTWRREFAYITSLDPHIDTQELLEVMNQVSRKGSPVWKEPLLDAAAAVASPKEPPIVHDEPPVCVEEDDSPDPMTSNNNNNNNNKQKTDSPSTLKKIGNKDKQVARKKKIEKQEEIGDHTDDVKPQALQDEEGGETIEDTIWSSYSDPEDEDWQPSMEEEGKQPQDHEKGETDDSEEPEWDVALEREEEDDSDFDEHEELDKGQYDNAEEPEWDEEMEEEDDDDDCFEENEEQEDNEQNKDEQKESHETAATTEHVQPSPNSKEQQGGASAVVSPDSVRSNSDSHSERGRPDSEGRISHSFTL